MLKFIFLRDIEKQMFQHFKHQEQKYFIYILC